MAPARASILPRAPSPPSIADPTGPRSSSQGLRSASTLSRVSAARRLAPAAASGALGGRPDARGSRLTARFSADGDTTGSMGGGSLASRLLSQSNFTSSSSSSAKAAAKSASCPPSPRLSAKAPVGVEQLGGAGRQRALDRVLGEIDANGKGSIMKARRAGEVVHSRPAR